MPIGVMGCADASPHHGSNTRNRRSPVSRVYGASSCVTSEVGAFLGHRRKHTQKANYEAAADEWRELCRQRVACIKSLQAFNAAL
jgi:hypothetical protein